MIVRSSRLRSAVALATVAVVAAACGSGSGDETDSSDSSDYPSDLITLVVPRSPGGGYDSYARGLAPILEEQLGTEIVVENMAGAAGRVAAEHLMDADPDGYTLLITDPEGLLAYQMVGDAGYDINEFVAFGTAAVRPSSVAVSGTSDLSDFDQLRETMAAEQLTFATTGVGSPTFLDAVLAFEAMGAQTPTIVPHEGSAEAITSVIRGDSDLLVFAFDTLDDEIESGELKPLVQFSEEPLDEIAPGVPTAAEYELSNLDGALASSLVLYGPPDLPADVDETLADAIDEVLHSDEFVQWGEESGYIVSPLDRAETQENIERRQTLYEENMDILEEYVTL